jgi:hypothetical protein
MSIKIKLRLRLNYLPGIVAGRATHCRLTTAVLGSSDSDQSFVITASIIPCAFTAFAPQSLGFAFGLDPCRWGPSPFASGSDPASFNVLA